MADRLDVAERLAEGRPAVERTETYLLACQRLGYHHPDLTSRPAQISDWYDSEEGLDLHALDSDCAQLRAAGTAISEALRVQRAQVLELAAAWAGPGADAAVRFLQRHCEGATTLATEVRAAAQRCESLRDNLWQLIDAKVATAIAIDDRTLVQRPLWSAAAGTVLAGAGDWSGAEEVLRGQVMPYVDDDIRGDWLTAMRSTLAGVTASYDMVTDRLAAAPRVCFEIAGDFGPGWRPGRSAWPTAPKAAAIPAAGVLDTVPSDPAPALTAVTPATPAVPTTAPTPSGLGAAMGDGAAAPLGGSGGLGGTGGLGELAGRIVDAMADLLGATTGPLADPLVSESPAVPDDPMDGDEADDAVPDDAGKVADANEAGGADAPASGTGTDGAAAARPPVARLPSGAEPPAIGTAPDAEPRAAGPPVTEPPGGGPPPASAPVNGSPPQPATNGSTPCEIAADELPKAGQ
ncbi:hypothetical protein LAUMK13_00890 [Mycobacterium innocens]|uniref:Uncharacterized protein n=1 Tax=Mycobacterium innocens TaxID=2341083 RepID=A0A498PQE1_9MYCO|nr:hypothetical protein [Mycobacterium innocens]VBA35775.1 hypothetical protein LAUMK13_00890 [Mycobacterium innocens]